MKTNDKAYDFFIRNWSFLKFEKYTVLIDETDNYISFINDRLFNELNTLMKSIDGKPVKLRDVIQLVNKSKKNE
ncbi:hypothetical protein ERICIV_02007 [Paenibacillus larvae subsp. larvae]|uniref:Uncharacterized protein n=1 Tax=Paenibacillus larvae subsp. larvae TaxID=147375 RepID=A0A2L1TZQ5_9BACL|nr:hypothetical protein [Paenibacillus larvae]AQT86527.1 hypothetical protein B1222_22460 [Paenibacillus larvae subsp. pulvifaciens]AQZ48190.1 hypothetical protein B5S25_18025 [Paenibacillus larvae subsp. pulvifaciens]AVF26155.1 hypothetical protein ERICIII_01986 [Paenibacillus larvae subsp. larvae]AVF30932.1 hypothetical protein ERICIV_02007 [Paenibacillus larvae subsp. larvae]MBH0343987.1 hypothetical protein [Paenibacillus larvae]